LNKKYLKLILKIGFSLVVLYFLTKKVNLVEIKDIITNSDIKVFVGVLFIYLLGQVVSSFKWKMISESMGFKEGFLKHTEYYFIGMFFNLFLPTTIGGDVAKCFYLSKSPDSPGKLMSLYSVFMDRFTGLLIISFMASLGLLSPLGQNINWLIKLPFVFLSLALLLCLFIPDILLLKFKENRFITNLSKTIKTFVDKPNLSFQILLIGLIFHLMVILIHIFIAKMIGIHISSLYYFIVYPISALAGFFPLSFNGIGPREYAYVTLFALAGVKAPDAISFSIIWFAIVFVSSLFGTIFYIKSDKKNITTNEFNLFQEAQE
jgi:hypothetical protein